MKQVRERGREQSFAQSQVGRESGTRQGRGSIHPQQVEDLEQQKTAAKENPQIEDGSQPLKGSLLLSEKCFPPPWYMASAFLGSWQWLSHLFGGRDDSLGQILHRNPIGKTDKEAIFFFGFFLGGGGRNTRRPSIYHSHTYEVHPLKALWNSQSARELSLRSTS